MNKTFVVILSIFIFAFAIWGIYQSVVPQTVDPLNGQHLKAVQPSGWFWNTDMEHKQAETNLTNAQAENQYGQAAEHYAVATHMISQSQELATQTQANQELSCMLPLISMMCGGILVLLIIGIVSGRFQEIGKL